MLPQSDTTNNMSGGVYIIGWALIGLGIHLWPAIFWGPMAVLCAIVTLVGGIWTFDTMRRWKWSRRRALLIMAGVPAVLVGLILLMPLPS